MDNPIQLAQEVKKLNPAEKTLGAEINSNHSILAKRNLRLKKLYLCVSDTPDGLFTGNLLKRYYQDRCEEVHCVKVEGLQSHDPKRFCNEGLRNLVREIAVIAKREREQGSELILNATGGFKAQISFAGLIGQLLEIPVFYMFESFQEVIELPPLPVDFSYDSWLKHYETLEILSKELVLDEQVSSNFNEVLIIREDGHCTLSALGELFHESFKRRFSKQKTNLQDSLMKPEEKAVRFEDNNAGKHNGLVEYFKQLLQVSFVTGVRTWYFNRDLPTQRRFTISSRCKYLNELEGWYSDGKATTKFILATTAQTELERRFALAALTERFVT